MATIYVATTGSDSNPGTAGSPRKTINGGLALAAPGDTVEVAPGSYAAFTAKAGSSNGGHITVTSRDLWAATITGETPLDKSYFKLVGFERTGGQWAHDITADFVEISSCLIHHVATDGSCGDDGGSAIEVYKSSYSTLMRGIKIVGNVVHTIGQGVGTNQLVQGIYLSNPGDSGCLIANNIIYGVDDFGIHGYRETAGWTIVHNISVGNGRGILVARPCRVHNNVAGDNRTDNYDLRATMTSCSNNYAFGTGGGTGISGVTRTTDPRFVNLTGRNLKLATGSPLLNAGTASVTVATDIDGVTRPQGNTPDVGAYETPGCAEARVVPLVESCDRTAPAGGWRGSSPTA